MIQTVGQAAHPVSVLLVEDEAMISHMVAEELSDHGFAVHEAATATEALSYVDSGGEVDVLFTDINLPGGIDGTELAVRVRAMRPEIPIVYSSGRYGALGQRQMVTRSVFVPKPYSLKDVCILLARLTDSVN